MIPLTTSNLLAVSIQAGVLVLAGAPLPRLLGIRSPCARLAYWRALLVACLLLPAVQPWRPDSESPGQVFAGPPVTAVTGPGGHQTAPPVPVPRGLAGRVDLFGLVAAGIAARGVWLAAGLVTLGSVRRRARPLEPRPASVDEAVSAAGADAEFRMAASATRPVTFGLLRPVVVLPADFGEFSRDGQKAIACHELIHVRRRDWVRNLGDEIVRAVAWFHPAAWWLTRQIRMSREELVDQEVVRCVGARRPYLDALLRLASPDRGSLLVPAPLALGRTHLSNRVSLLVKEVRMSRPRLVLSFLAMVVLLLGTGRAVVGAFPLRAVVEVESVLAGPDQQTGSAPQPGKKVMKAAAPGPAQAPRRVRDARPAFPAGSGETPVVMAMKVDAGGNVVAVGVVSGPADLAVVAAEAMRKWRFSPTGAAMTTLVGFNPAASTGLGDQPPVLVGKTMKPPVKIKDVKPVYPDEARKAGVQGVTVLEARIASDGTVAEARILRSVAGLDEAALAALLQWKFEAPGFPVQMTVTVNFTLADRPKPGVEKEAVGSFLGGLPGAPPPPAPAASAPVRVGGDIEPPKKTLDVRPVYPQDAKDAGVQGIVIIEATIGPDGKVVDTKIVRSVPALDQAAVDAVKQWEFTPTIRNGQAVSVIMTVTVSFKLQ